MDDYTSPAAAINPLCGNASCQVPTAYNTPASTLTPLVQQRVRVGRTLADTSGTWETRVEVTKYSYNSSGLLEVEDGPLPGNADTVTYEYYDVLGPPASAGRLKKVWHGTRLVAEYQDYNAMGRAQRVLDGNGQAAVYTIDDMGRILSVKGPDDPQPTVFIYSASGKRQEVRLPLGNRLIYGYNTRGQLVSVGRTYTASGTPSVFDEEVRYEWDTTNDDFGRMARESFLREGTVVRTTTYGRDAQGRQAEVRHLRVEQTGQMQAAVRLTTLNEYGDIVDTQVGVSSDTWVNDLEGKTNYLYDNLQRLARLERAGSATPHNFRCDAHDNITEVNEVFDPQYVTSYPQTKYLYDDFGRLVSVTSTNLGTRRYVYDLAGNRVQEYQPTGQILTSTYDDTGRLKTITGPDYSATVTYDTNEAATVLDCATGTALGVSHGIGRLTSVAEASGITYFGYTPGGRPRFEARLAPGATCAKTIHWEYDGNRNLAAVRYPSGARVRYEYPVGTAHMHVPNAVTMEVQGTTMPLATGLTWTAGALTHYTANNGLSWHFSRWLDGSPREWKVTRGEDETVVRSRVFGEEVNGALEPRLDGRGSPMRIEEDVPAWTRGYTYEEGTGYVSTETQPPQERSYLYGGTGTRADRYYLSTMPVPTPPDGMPKDSEFYTYNGTNFRLTEANLTEIISPTSYLTTNRRFTYAAGGRVTQVNTNNRLLAFCYDSREQVAAVVGPGGQYSREHFNCAREARPTPAQQPGFTLSRTLPTQVQLPAPASAVLRFEGYSLASCDTDQDKRDMNSRKHTPRWILMLLALSLTGHIVTGLLWAKYQYVFRLHAPYGCQIDTEIDAQPLLPVLGGGFGHGQLVLGCGQKETIDDVRIECVCP